MAAWVDAAKFAQAMRKIVESVNFWNMRPVRDDGSEYDNLVVQGPVPGPASSLWNSDAGVVLVIKK